MTQPWKSKRPRVMLAFLVPACLIFWFLTAPAGMALQRIASGGNGGPLARVICSATDWYESPMVYVDRVPALRRLSDSLGDQWSELLGAPETTP
jgi:hypothetical protein